MTYDPNLPPSSRGRPNDPDIASPRSGSTAWMIGLLIIALVIIGAFFVWPDSTNNVAGSDRSATTGSTSAPRAPAPAAPSTPSTPAPSAPAAPR